MRVSPRISDTSIRLAAPLRPPRRPSPSYGAPPAMPANSRRPGSSPARRSRASPRPRPQTRRPAAARPRGPRASVGRCTGSRDPDDGDADTWGSYRNLGLKGNPFIFSRLVSCLRQPCTFPCTIRDPTVADYLSPPRTESAARAREPGVGAAGLVVAAPVVERELNARRRRVRRRLLRAGCGSQRRAGSAVTSTSCCESTTSGIRTSYPVCAAPGAAPPAPTRQHGR